MCVCVVCVCMSALSPQNSYMLSTDYPNYCAKIKKSLYGSTLIESKKLIKRSKNQLFPYPCLVRSTLKRRWNFEFTSFITPVNDYIVWHV